MTAHKCPLCDDTGFKDHAGFAMDPCHHGPTEQQCANHAASQAIGAAVELLRYAREGALSRDFAFADDPIAMLAKALASTIAIEAPRLADEHRYFGVDADGTALLGDLSTALARFIEGWS